MKPFKRLFSFPSPDETPLVIYHGKCTDGFTAATAAWMFFGGKGEYFGAQYGKFETVDDLPHPNGRPVYIVDFSFPPEFMNQLGERTDKLVLLDHHKSAMDSLNGFTCYCGDEHRRESEIHFDMDRSGAMMSWDYFFPDVEPPALFKHVQDRDLWQWKLQGTREFLESLDMVDQDFGAYARIAQMGEDEMAQFMCDGDAMNRKYMKIVGEITKGAVPIRFNGQDGLLVSCHGQFASDVGNILAAKCGSFAMMWDVGHDKVKVSVRSVKGFDSIPLSSSMGGGGHQQASGFAMPLDRLLELLSGTFNSEKSQ